MWYLYIVECENKTLYTGITNDLQRRFSEHKYKKSHFTKYNYPVKIVYQESFQMKEDAAKREKQIKGWTRKKKLALIKGDFVLLKKL